MTIELVSARDFIDGGGVLSLGEWMALDPDSREAFATAGRERETRMIDDALEKIAQTLAASFGAVKLERLMKDAEALVAP